MIEYIKYDFSTLYSKARNLPLTVGRFFTGLEIKNIEVDGYIYDHLFSPEISGFNWYDVLFNLSFSGFLNKNNRRIIKSAKKIPIAVIVQGTYGCNLHKSPYLIADRIYLPEEAGMLSIPEGLEGSLSETTEGRLSEEVLVE